MGPFRFTEIHVNAMGASALVFIGAMTLVLLGEFCGGVGLLGTIGLIATQFAKRGNGGREESSD